MSRFQTARNKMKRPTLALLLVAAAGFWGFQLHGQDPPKHKIRGGLTGVQEFFTSGTFTVPDGVSHVMVTMWGEAVLEMVVRSVWAAVLAVALPIPTPWYRFLLAQHTTSPSDRVAPAA